jgi:hypothetical protein
LIKAAVTQDLIARSSNIGPIALVRTLNIVYAIKALTELVRKTSAIPDKGRKFNN